jgi:hypothetical protein
VTGAAQLKTKCERFWTLPAINAVLAAVGFRLLLNWLRLLLRAIFTAFLGVFKLQAV